MAHLVFILCSLIPCLLLVISLIWGDFTVELGALVAFFYATLTWYLRRNKRHRKTLESLSQVLNYAASGELHHRATHTQGYGVATELAWAVNELLDVVETYFKEVKLCFVRVNRQDFSREAKSTGLPGDFSESLKSINQAILAIKENLDFTQQNALTSQIHDINLQSLRKDLLQSESDIRSVQGDITDVDCIAKENSKVAKSSSGAIRKMSENLHQSTEQIKQLQKQAESLIDVSDEVARALNLISDIADQTNLLALNASVEAARAGQSGRGFAVVADEVKNLSNRTKDTATEVYSALRALNEQVAAISDATLSSNALSLEVTDQLDDFLQLFHALETSSAQTSEKVIFVAGHAESAVERIAQVILKQNIYACLEEIITSGDGSEQPVDVRLADIQGQAAKPDDPCFELVRLVDMYRRGECTGDQLILSLKATEQNSVC
ncbi:methyl-accepting chemotaxis protein [Oceanospirillum sp.]|uniref:methyl-accepting chemotaxis protein n=1 Tax=Oceanospirillum sp. TaxID=2021254 RepID=UPI003A958A70